MGDGHDGGNPVTGLVQGAKNLVKSAEKEIGVLYKHRSALLDYLLRSKDLKVPSFTLYVYEDIGIQDILDRELKPADAFASQITGVYIPPSVTSLDTVNVIFYLHGDKVRIWGGRDTIREYLNLPQLPLRQGLNASGKDYILVAPTMGKKTGGAKKKTDPQKEIGNVGKDIDDHLNHVLSLLPLLGPPQYAPPTTPKIGKLIIAGHSGGYAAIQSILAGMSTGLQAKLQEIWGFDIMYGNTADSLKSLKVPVYAYFNNTEDNSRALAAMAAKSKATNFFVMEPTEFFISKGKMHSRRVIHDLIMQEFWLDRCQRIGTNGTHPEDKKRMVHG